jgi:hypothetical protein
MIVLQFVVGAIALGCLAALVCRLDAMNLRTHQPTVIGMHVGMALGCAWSLYEAGVGHLSPGSVGSVAGAACWLWVSLPTWAKGPPVWTETGPGDLMRSELSKVVNLRKDQ